MWWSKVLKRIGSDSPVWNSTLHYLGTPEAKGRAHMMANRTATWHR